MNCAGSNDWWQRGLDGEPIPPKAAAELERHLAECPPCRQLHATASLFAGPRLVFDRPAPPAGLAERLVAAVQTDRRRRRQRQFMLVGAMAASLLIAGLVFYGLRFAGQGGSKPEVASHSQQPDDHGAPAAAGLDRSVQEARSALMALTRRTADKTLADSRLLLPDVRPPESVPNPALLESALETPADSLREAGTGLTKGLEPVASSARRAVELFWQDMSPMASGNDSGL
ncbi:MAG TPA: zf-HC2 domain-containing protein [Gemmataceae bacterium]|nr:zf-HC2 domain-containing protein [Gemmataceae bacterium]